MADSFASLYEPLSKDVFQRLAREQLAEGGEASSCAQEYAEQGKPDFALAFLLLTDLPDEEKRTLFARAYSRRAEQTLASARQFEQQYRRNFSLLKLEAEKDTLTAKTILAGQALA